MIVWAGLNLPAIGIMIKQKTVSAIISDTWKTHKHVYFEKNLT